MINKWKKLLLLGDWDIRVESINPNAVMYDSDCPSEERYYVGVQPDHNTKTATIYHDRELTERDVIHELLHIKFPKWSEEQVNEMEGILYNVNN